MVIQAMEFVLSVQMVASYVLEVALQIAPNAKLLELLVISK